jgi:SAM-dependent methyltransferase
MSASVTSSTVNSPEYWNERFRTDWAAQLGQQQTVFFADLIIKYLPQWLTRQIERRRLSVYDFGCAEGDAVPWIAARFPLSHIAGGDVSSVAVETARARYPKFTFDLLSAEAASLSADVVISSNTFEHFADWQNRLEHVASRAKHSLVLLVPFQEQQPLFHEHMIAFDFGTLPPLLAYGARLVFHSVVDTTDLPGSRWVGRQVLAVWTRAALQKNKKENERVGDIDFGTPTNLICSAFCHRQYRI